jgi:hypothetical protein
MGARRIQNEQGMVKGKRSLVEKTESEEIMKGQLQLSILYPFTTLGQSSSIRCKSKPFFSLFQYLEALVQPDSTTTCTQLLFFRNYCHLLEPQGICEQLVHHSKDRQPRTVYHRGRGGW